MYIFVAHFTIRTILGKILGKIKTGKSSTNFQLITVYNSKLFRLNWIKINWYELFGGYCYWAEMKMFVQELKESFFSQMKVWIKETNTLLKVD